MDQLFDRYQAWRTTKAALIYFCRRKDTSDALAHLKEQMQAHPCQVFASQSKIETRLRFKFHHPNNGKRRLGLAVLLFSVEI